jgi:hypothetical protein
MDIVSLIIQLLSGAVGGNIAGSIFKNWSLGTAGNSIVGVIGGVLTGQVLGPLLGPGAKAVATSGLDPMAIIGQIASGGIGGGVLMVIVGLIKSMMAK